MNIERKPVAFGDLRGWIKALEAAGEIKEIDAEVDWNIEIGTVMRLAQGSGDGPALIFNTIKDYGANARCRRIFGCGLSSYRRVAMMLGVAPDTHPRELVRLGRNVLNGSIPPKIVATGPVKENIVTGDDIDLYEFPSPWWNRLDGGRYLLTYGGCVTKDHDTGTMNVGIYRGMVASRNQIPILMWRAQHVGQHATSWERAGHKSMPIAVAIGWEPSLGFTGGAPVQKGVCEYDVMGSIRGAPVELVKCETVDLHVPASAEIVIEGYLQLDPAKFAMEGPFAEFTGYLAGDKSPKPTIRVTAITHRNDPILRGSIEGSLPGSFSENAICSSIMRAATAWSVLERAGVPGITDVWCPPVHAGINLLIQMKQSYRGQAKQAASAAVDWAIAYRVNAGEDDIVIMPSTFGAGLDPSTRRRDRNPALFGTGKWNRVLIDATMNLDYDPDPDLGGARFPPKVWPGEADVAAVAKRWGEFKLKPLK